MARPIAKLVSMLTPKRRWAQFSLATMFLVVTVLCVGLSLVVVPAERQRRAVAAIEALGGQVRYVKPDKKASEAFPRRFPRRWLPRDYVDRVQYVDLRRAQVTDAGLAHLHGLTGLKHLWLTQITDAELAHLQGLTGLEALYSDQGKVTDAGLSHLHGLKRLKSFNLDLNRVTDAGLAHLQGLTNLEELCLAGTQVTDAGLAHLQGLKNLRVLDLDGTKVTDAGLAFLDRLTGLRVLWLCGTQVEDARLAQLRQALPNCRINRQ